MGTLLAAGLMAFAWWAASPSISNRASLSVSLLVLLALLGPRSCRRVLRAVGGESAYRLNPVTAGEHYVGKLLTNGHGWTRSSTGWSPP